MHGGELPQALPAQILGMAFEDFEHNRRLGSGGNGMGAATRNCHLTIVAHIIGRPYWRSPIPKIWSAEPR